MSSPSLSREHLGLWLGFIGVAVFGGTLPATRIAVSVIDPIALTALRTAIAGLCSLVLLIALRRPLPPRRLWPQLSVAMLGVCILFPFLMALAVQTVDASHGGVVMGILPIATAIVAVLITHERPKPLFWIASLAGAALVVAFALRQDGGTLASGDLLLFAAVAAAAIGYAFSGRLTAEMPMGSHQLGAGNGAAGLTASNRTHPADRSCAYRPQTMARGTLRRAVLAMDRIFRVERRHGDGRHRAGIAGAAAATVHDLCARRLVQRRDDHAADSAVRRGRCRNRSDQHAHTAATTTHSKLKIQKFQPLPHAE